MSWYGDWAPYVPVAKKIALGHAAAKKLAKKEGREPCPIRLEGRKIAKTFWGLKWCENLERYRDIANRLPRGATYVRNGSVADLVIEPGRIRAIVGGSEAYTIEIKIKTLPPAVWQAIGRDCAQAIESLFDLLQGRFNAGVMQRLTQAEGGLFPRSSEITMRCSCPDYADVCKHIAATFYGVAARLDTQPELLFKLRNVDHLELIGHATSAANLDRALRGDDGATLTDGDLGEIFGIELDSPDKGSPSSVQSPSKSTGKRAPGKSVQPTGATQKKRPKVASPARGSVSRSTPPVAPTAKKRMSKTTGAKKSAKPPAAQAMTPKPRATQTRSEAKSGTNPSATPASTGRTSPR